MREKADPAAPEPSVATAESTRAESTREEPAAADEREAPAGPGASRASASSVPEMWIAAYQEAQRQLVDVHSTYQRAMTEAHFSFLKAMQESLAGLRLLAPNAQAEMPALDIAPAVPRDEADEPRWAAGGPASEPEAPSAEAPATPPVAEKPWAVWENGSPGTDRGPERAETPGEEPARLATEPVGTAAAEQEPADTIETASSAAAPPSQPAGAAAGTVAPGEALPADAPPAPRRDAEEEARSAPAPVDVRFGRFALQAEPAAPVGLAMSGLASVSRIVVTDEGTGIASALVEQLQARGVAAAVVTEVPTDVSGAIFLGGLRPIGSFEDTIEVNREAFGAATTLAPRWTTGRGVFVTVQDTGGDFGLSGRAGERAGLSGLSGLAKTARLEWPGVTVKAIDLERAGRPAWKVAKVLAEEFFGGGPEIEVGLHADGGRVSLEAYQALLNLGAGRGSAAPEGVYSVVDRSGLDQSSVIVAAGVERGATAAALIALARNARPRMVLLGAASLGEEPETLREIEDDASLRRALHDQAWSEGRAISPEELDDELERLHRNREIRAHLRALHQAGSEVRYETVDVTDAAALVLLLEEIRQDWGSVTGLVYGAGVPSDRLLADAGEADFDRVFGRRVVELFNLLRVTAEDALDLILLVSSASARTGRRGQAESAMADEVMNKVAAAEHARRGDACLVKALNWNLRDGGDGAGDPEDGARALPVDVATRMLIEEIQAGIPDQVEVVLGRLPDSETDARPSALNMLTMDAFVSAATHPFLEGYRIGDVPILPMPLVLEWFHRITRAHCDELEMVACRDVKVLRSVRLEGFYEGGDAFTVVSHQHQRGAGRELHLELYARDGSLRHTAVADMARPGTMVSASSDTARLIRAAQTEQLRAWPFSSIYGHALFQGPECQVIREVQGVGDDGIVAIIAGAREMGWAEGWRTDIAALEGGLQLASLWFQYQLGGTALTTGIASYHSHFSGLVEGPIRAVLRGKSEGFQRVLCDVVFVNENGTLVGELRGVEARAFIKPASVPEPEVSVEVDEEPAGDDRPEEQAEELPPEDDRPEDVRTEETRSEEAAPSQAASPENEPTEPERLEEAPSEDAEDASAAELVSPEETPAEETRPESAAEFELVEEPDEPEGSEIPAEPAEDPERDEPEGSEPPAEPAEGAEPDEPETGAETAAETASDTPPEAEEVPAEEGGPRPAAAFSLSWQDKATRIAAVLDGLLGRIQPNAFVVFSARGTSAFVRFVGGEGKLYLDLPGNALEGERMSRAEQYFDAIGVRKESTEIYEAGQLAGGYESFGMELGDDVTRATQLALDVFSEIYRLGDDFDLEIQES